MTAKLFVTIALITIVDSQLPGLSNFGRTMNRARNQGRRFQETVTRPNVASIETSTNLSIPTIRRGSRVNIQVAATPGRGRIILTQRMHPNTERRGSNSQEEALENEFRDFTILFNKSYPTPEIEFLRKQNFFANRLAISRFNQDYSFGLNSFILQINQFADLLVGEFNQNLNGFRGGNRREPDPNFPRSAYIQPININRPESIDWRELGAVSPVKYQGMCASCHAFSTAGAIEGHNFRKTGTLVELSPQNLIDCPTEENYQSFGCSGGYVDENLKYIRGNPGIDREDSYAYEGIDGTCRFNENAIGANITGYVEIPEGDENALESAVATLGPVSVGIDASQMTFQFYSQGVYYDENCGNRGENINHAMLVVGYGVEPDGQRFWLVKNSYGTQWGTGGYVKIAKDRNNHCGIATSAVYPLV